METLKQCLEQHRIIRQVFLYDRNPEVVRAIHSEMQRVFSNACFSPPVENVDINKGYYYDYYFLLISPCNYEQKYKNMDSYRSFM